MSSANKMVSGGSISDGYHCCFEECPTCDPVHRDTLPGECRTCQCDECGDLFQLKDNDSFNGICYTCMIQNPEKNSSQDETYGQTKMDLILSYILEKTHITQDSSEENLSALQKKYESQRAYLDSSCGEYLSKEEAEAIDLAKEILDSKLQEIHTKLNNS